MSTRAIESEDWQGVMFEDGERGRGKWTGEGLARYGRGGRSHEKGDLEEQSGMKGGMEAKSNRCFFTMGIQAHA